MKTLTLFTSATLIILLLNGCSMAKLTVRASMPLIEGGIQALNKESDLILAHSAIPANIELLEGMLVNDPENQRLREYAAQAYYGYAYGFIEDDDKQRASRIYLRGLKHGQHALQQQGLDATVFDAPLDNFQAEIETLDDDALAALFWTASCWAKWIDMNRDQAYIIAQLPKAVTLMQRVLTLDEHYYLASAHTFFGVYYGSRSPMLGGDFKKSKYHFDIARTFNNNKLLIIDLLQAQYLDYQQFNQPAFHNRLKNIVTAPENLYPEQALINAIARQKAKLLLEKEDQWF